MVINFLSAYVLVVAVIVDIIVNLDKIISLLQHIS